MRNPELKNDLRKNVSTISNTIAQAEEEKITALKENSYCLICLFDLKVDGVRRVI